MKISFIDKHEDEEARLFWVSKSSEERLSAVEFLREQYYIIQGYQNVPQMIKELTIVEMLK